MATVADFLIERIKNLGIKHVFGVLGRYNIDICKCISSAEDMKFIPTTNELHAGFAADAYARVSGVGCVCVDFNVGLLKLADAVACAYTERSPLIVIGGAPGEKEESLDFAAWKSIEETTCSRITLNKSEAGYDIDSALEKLNFYKLPIYIEVPRDLLNKPVTYDVYKQGTPDSPKTKEGPLSELLGEIEGLLEKASRPVIIAGVQISRFGLSNELMKFAIKSNIPVATTPLSKSVISETHPLSLGVYASKGSSVFVQKIVDESDCVLVLGHAISDTEGRVPVEFDRVSPEVSVSVNNTRVKNHWYKYISFSDVIKGLAKIETPSKESSVKWEKSYEHEDYEPKKGARITVKRLFDKINSILDPHMAIIADAGDSLFGSINLITHRHNHFLSPLYHGSKGFSIPAALGVQLAKPDVRPIVIVGDGGFQCSCTELGMISLMGLNPIVIILNNHGSAVRRLTGEDFCPCPEWNYEQISQMISRSEGFKVENEIELEEAFTKALKSSKLFVINVIVQKDDVSPVLRRMIEAHGKQVC